MNSIGHKMNNKLTNVMGHKMNNKFHAIGHKMMPLFSQPSATSMAWMQPFPLMSNLINEHYSKPHEQKNIIDRKINRRNRLTK